MYNDISELSASQFMALFGLSDENLANIRKLGRIIEDISYDADSYGALPEHIAPLTDPTADAFIEQVKRWKPEPMLEPLLGVPTKEKV